MSDKPFMRVKTASLLISVACSSKAEAAMMAIIATIAFVSKWYLPFISQSALLSDSIAFPFEFAA